MQERDIKINFLCSILHVFVQLVSLNFRTLFLSPLQTKLMLHCNNESSSTERSKQFTLLSSREDLSRSLLRHLRQWWLTSELWNRAVYSLPALRGDLAVLLLTSVTAEPRPFTETQHVCRPAVAMCFSYPEHTT